MRPSVPAGRDAWSATGLAALAVAYLVAARRYALDSLATPGPGLFPLLLGVLLLFLAAGQLVVLVRRRGAGGSAGGGAGGNGEPAPRHGAPVLMMGALGLYAASVTWVGFLTASGLLVLVAARLMGTREWWRAVALALGVVAGTYLLFALWLGVPLPAGRFR